MYPFWDFPAYTPTQDLGEFAPVSGRGLGASSKQNVSTPSKLTSLPSTDSLLRTIFTDCGFGFSGGICVLCSSFLAEAFESVSAVTSPAVSALSLFLLLFYTVKRTHNSTTVIECRNFEIVDDITRSRVIQRRNEFAAIVTKEDMSPFPFGRIRAFWAIPFAMSRILSYPRPFPPNRWILPCYTSRMHLQCLQRGIQEYRTKILLSILPSSPPIGFW